ncbi:nuclear transport factor 2 family protein [Pseudotamlana agarivorans]|uniref:nuclear transport factor 2 family protein n=1 Tax=Pseudotamlana agarivorans TaxID=481183 RepID=UPI00082A70F1|nr:DNA-binding protein [Tamlana agarivorans]
MVKIITNTDCGNAPKKEFIKQFNIAFAQGDIDFISENVTDNFEWQMIGKKQIKGKSNFIEALKEMQAEDVVELILEKVLTHGKEGAASGILKMKNGKDYAFSDFYTFSSAKGSQIKALTSYVIEIS